MRRANESLIRERHQIPKLEEILPELNNAKYFSNIDLREGYHHMELDPSSRHVTAFIAHEGTFQSECLAYGPNQNGATKFSKTNLTGDCRMPRNQIDFRLHHYLIIIINRRDKRKIRYII